MSEAEIATYTKDLLRDQACHFATETTYFLTRCIPDVVLTLDSEQRCGSKKDMRQKSTVRSSIIYDSVGCGFLCCERVAFRGNIDRLRARV